jgi:hypothetical protein
MKPEYIPLFVILLIGVVFISGCVQQTTTPSGTEQEKLAQTQIQTKMCEDNTIYNKCSSTKPKFCDNGTLIDKSSLCGCPQKYDVFGESCVKKKCSDGTIVDECSVNKPKFCTENGLIDNPVNCGCQNEYELIDSVCKPPKTLEITDNIYSANGLKFEVSLPEYGSKISYKDKSGAIQYVNAQTNKKLLKFDITVTSIDGEKSFYSSSFVVMDLDGNTYEAQCPIDIFQNCKNSDSLESMYDPIEGQKKTGILMFQIPVNINKVYLIYKFSGYGDRPEVLKFVFTGI